MEAVIKSSRYPYAETIERLTQTITAGGNTLFAKIDQAAAAQSVGLTLRPTTLLIFGNPKGGTPLMNAFPIAALDLPLKLLVWDEAGMVSVAHTPMAVVAQRYGLTGEDTLLAAFDRALEALVASISII